MISRAVPTVVTGLGLLLGAAVVTEMAVSHGADYARLFPAPNEIEWVQDDGRETVLDLKTNLDGVEVRVSGLDNASAGAEPALGIGSIQTRDPESGTAVTLARGQGCDDAYNTANVATDDNGTPDDASDDTAYNYDSLWLPAGAALGIYVCEDSAAAPAATDGVIALYTGAAPGGELLTSYDVDGRLPADSAVNRAPAFSAAYTTGVVCVDGSSQRALYLDGGEQVTFDPAGSASTRFPAAADPDGDTLTYALGLDDPDGNYAFFTVATATINTFTVNALGGNDHSGLADDRVYPVLITARDGQGGSDTLEAVIQLDLTCTSTNGDGLP